jgi:hypothetical protein
MEIDMKKTMIILAAILMAGSQLNAQLVLENEAAMVYYMPKNELAITLHYTVVDEEPGIFYQYAKRYLGAKQVITESKRSCVLTHVSTELLTSADTNRAYKITAGQGIKEQLISLSDDGRLLGYNVAIEEATELQLFSGKAESYCIENEVLMPLLEEQFVASSTAKMAEGAAKLIYRLRETRLNLLAGEVEHVPADGKSMELVLAELEKQEQALVELFVGKKKVSSGSKTLRYKPEECVYDAVLCRFSLHSGVVDANDLSGEPLYISVDATQEMVQPLVEENSKAPALSQLYYNLPGEADVVLKYKGEEWMRAHYQIAQLGVAIPLAKQWFTGKDIPVIRLNPETGNILSIEQ